MTATSSPADKIAVVGAGVAGLSCAVFLAIAGREVILLEKEPCLGGKVHEVDAGPARLDGGPTVLTMRWVFEDLFSRAGASLDSRLALQPAGVLARHAWQDAGILDLHVSREDSAAAIADFAGEGDAQGYLRFCRDAGATFNALRHSYIEAQRPNPLQLAWRVAREDPRGLLALNPFSTLWSALGRYFDSPHLRQLYARYATYCGSSPFLSPATLMLVAHVEQEGVWLVAGGMRALATAMERLARDLGVTILKDASVLSIERRGAGLELRTQDRGAMSARAAVWCGDVSALAGIAPQSGLRPVPPAQRSLSAMVWAMRGRVSGLQPARHTVCFSKDYRDEFDTIFNQRRLPPDPTVYVCAQDRDAANDTGEAGAVERIYLLVNAPADGDRVQADGSETDRCLENAMKTLTACGMTIAADPQMTLTTPADWNRLYPATGGALYGRASHGWTASFRRPGSRTALPGLYFAGGSAHPGPGVPMAVLSGRLAAESLVADLASTRRYYPANISGGTSTA